MAEKHSSPEDRTKNMSADDTDPTILPLDSAPADAPVSDEVARIMSSARAASDFLKAVAHENRLLILCLLAEREHSVTELEEVLSLRQTAVSQQLARLRLDNLVTARRDGKSVHYSLADPQIKLLLDVLYTMYCRDK